MADEYDHLDGAKQMMAQYWNRQELSDDLEVDAKFRIAEALPIIAEALIAIAEKGRI